MDNWKYSLNAEGKALREAIHGGDNTTESCIRTLQHLLLCLKRLKSKLPEDEYIWYFDDLKMNVEASIEEFQEAVDSNFEGFSEDGFYIYAEDCVNEMLGEFYDGCDCLRIWIGL